MELDKQHASVCNWRDDRVKQVAYSGIRRLPSIVMEYPSPKVNYAQIDEFLVKNFNLCQFCSQCIIFQSL
jgi:hypothetical protein